jgi:hypothetical protein
VGFLTEKHSLHNSEDYLQPATLQWSECLLLLQIQILTPHHQDGGIRR